MQASFKELSPAKLNLFLKIVGKREDGFHNIRSGVTLINLFDEVIATKNSRFTLKYIGRFAPENNNLPTAFRCSGVLSERCPSGLKKQLKMFFDAGIDGVFVDDPATAKEALAEY